jgi:hypothetical protein
MHYALTFGLLGAVLTAAAVRLAGEAEGSWWLLVGAEAYASACLLALAVAYGLRSAGLPVEAFLTRPGPGALARGVLFPYTALAGFVMAVARRVGHEPLMNEVAPGLLIGRVPFRPERDRLVEAGVGAVLNLCWEFPATPALKDLPDVRTARLPILDGAPPTPRQFREAVQDVARWRAEGRTVLIHCAQGHGRSATVAAAVLARLGLAPGATEALARVRQVRPRARPSREQRAALERFLGSPATAGEALDP